MTTAPSSINSGTESKINAMISKQVNSTKNFDPKYPGLNLSSASNRSPFFKSGGV